MRILTLNLWGIFGPPQRRPVLIQQLQTLQADILCLQEATDPDLLKVLAYPTCIHHPEPGLAILSRFPARSQRSIIYKTVSPLEPYRRGALLAELETDVAALWVATTHLSWKAEDDASRLGQAEELARILEPLPDPLLLSGDFNAPPSAPPVQGLLKVGFVDLFAALHPSEPGITWDNRNPFIQSHSVRFPDRRIDLLLLRQRSHPSLKAVACEVVFDKPSAEWPFYPSDHYGVLTTLSR